jgi:hypothetical protein
MPGYFLAEIDGKKARSFEFAKCDILKNEDFIVVAAIISDH